MKWCQHAERKATEEEGVALVHGTERERDKRNERDKRDKRDGRDERDGKEKNNILDL